MRWSWGVLRGQRQRVAKCLLEVFRDPGGKDMGAAEVAPLRPGCAFVSKPCVLPTARM